MIDKLSVENCTLCGSCINACPAGAINFSKKYLDFEYPQIDTSRCIKCNLCGNACPVLSYKYTPKHQQPVALAGMSKNNEVRLNSSSGGIFYELAAQMLRDGGSVCGAVFDENFHVRHIVSNNHDDILRMMGSKYAQSNMGYCFRTIKQKLDSGEKVLFSGCPCQVAGLRTFLSKQYDNLLLVELICHGIPSDHMLHTYIEMQQKRYKSKLKQLEFRNKKTVGTIAACV